MIQHGIETQEAGQRTCNSTKKTFNGNLSLFDFAFHFFCGNALVFYHNSAHNNLVDYQIDGGITAIDVYSSYRYTHTYFCTSGISITIPGQNRILPLQNITKYLFV